MADLAEKKKKISDECFQDFLQFCFVPPPFFFSLSRHRFVVSAAHNCRFYSSPRFVSCIMSPALEGSEYQNIAQPSFYLTKEERHFVLSYNLIYIFYLFL